MEAEIYETAKLSISYLKPFHQRFIVIEESLSGHCCFGYTILDTQKVDQANIGIPEFVKRLKKKMPLKFVMHLTNNINMNSKNNKIKI